MSDRPFAYVCSSYRGDTEANAEKARGYCREVFKAGYTPWAPHIYFSQFLKEDIPQEREAGMEMGAALLSQCRVLVVCGGEITEGMSREIRLAEQLHVPILALDAFLSEQTPEKISAAELAQMPRDTGDAAHERLGGVIRAYITNADKYAEGELIGVWHPFPTTAEDVHAALKAIGVDGVRHGDYYIDDYETGISGLYDRLPLGADIDELNHLAVKLEGMSGRERNVFEAVMLSGRHCNSVKDIINAAGNLNCFTLRPVFNEAQYGLHLARSGSGEASRLADKLENSDNPSDRTAASLIGLLEWYLDAEGMGQNGADREKGSFTERGYLTEGSGLMEIYTGPEDIPAEYRVTGPAASPQARGLDAPGFEKRIQPFYWVEHGGDHVSVCLYVSIVNKPTYKEEVFAARRDEGFYGTGYDWTSLAVAFLEEKMPELQGVVNFDPEHSMFCAYSGDRAALEHFTLVFKDTCENDAAIRDLFSRVDKDLYLKAYEHEEPQAVPREITEKPSVLEQIAASRAERGAAPEKNAPDKHKSRGPEL